MVTLPNNTCIPVRLHGDLRINSQLILKDVLLVPQFHINLISVSALTAISPLTISFFADHFIIQDSTNQKMIGKGDKDKDLYILDVDKFNLMTDNVSLQPEEAIHILLIMFQFRYGITDLAIYLLRFLTCWNSNCTATSQIGIDNLLATICPLAKQRKLPFISHNHLSLSPFDLIHCDIWGPYHVDAYTGHRFFLTMVDDCIRFTWVFMLKQKYNVNTVIPYFFNMIATQFQCAIKGLRFDNAKELALTAFFNQKRVLHQYSSVATPQQNSVVERKHQHILNVARALFFSI